MLHFIITILLLGTIVLMASGKPYGGIKGHPYSRIALEGAQVTSGIPAPTDESDQGKKKARGKGSNKFFNPMALIKGSGIGIGSISGKIAGTVFTPGGSAGAFARIWTKPRNGRTSFQQFVRGILAGISGAFRSLTPDQVTAWRNSANDTNPNSVRRNAFGDTKVMSGFQLFNKVNNILLSIGLVTISDPPASVGNDSVVGIALTATAPGTLTFDATLFSGGAALPADTFMKVYATPLRSNGRSYISPSSLRFIGFFPPTTSVTAMDVSTMYTDRFGSLVTGAKVSVAVEIVSASIGTVNTFGKTGKVYATINVA